mgnify:CR=1 FL=1
MPPGWFTRDGGRPGAHLQSVQHDHVGRPIIYRAAGLRKGLLDAGVSLQSARRAIEYLRDHLGEDIATASLVINGAGSVLVRTDGELVDLVRRGQGVLSIVALGGVKEALDAAITELRPGRETPSASHPSMGAAGAIGGGG